MRKLNAGERLAMRSQVLDLVERGLPPMLLMPIPEVVKTYSWFKESEIEKILRIYALPSFRMHTFNGKLQPALGALLIDEAAGKFNEETNVLGASSANWAAQCGFLKPIFNFKDFYGVIDASVPQGKREHLEASGAKILVAPKGVASTDYVYELVQRPNWHLIDQYVHPGSIQGHKWTMDHITREMWRINQPPSFFGAVTGTCSTLMAAKQYLQPEFPGVKIWGVASMSEDEKVPGSRSLEGLEKLRRIGGFRYETAIDGDLITSVSRDEAFEANAELVQRYFITAGPTGALLLVGVYHRLCQHWIRYGNFDALKNGAGFVVGAIFIVDMHLPYLGDSHYRRFFQ